MGTNNNMALSNDAAFLSIELFGGAITNFHLKAHAINPLTFAFSSDQMPANNKAGAPFRGHFLCLGRWGAPSEEEQKTGIPNHGQAANIMWQALATGNNHSLMMQADSDLEGLCVERTVKMDEQAAVYAVREAVCNTKPLGRLYNMVQHPTLAAPFLHSQTTVRCNGTVGFDQFRQQHPETNALHWPVGRDTSNDDFDLIAPDKAYSSVFSFIVDKTSEYGWITAFSPQHELLLGYVWRRTDYPWIHLWQHWHNNIIQYRGIEFGTAGIHQPFKKIIETGVKLFGENTVDYIEPGETVTRKYLSFLHKTSEDIKGIRLQNGGEQIVLQMHSKQQSIRTNFKDFL